MLYITFMALRCYSKNDWLNRLQVERKYDHVRGSYALSLDLSCHAHARTNGYSVGGKLLGRPITCMVDVVSGFQLLVDGVWLLVGRYMDL